MSDITNPTASDEQSQADGTSATTPSVSVETAASVAVLATAPAGQTANGDCTTLSLVVPCYNEGPALDLFYTEVDRVSKEMPCIDLEIIFVDDGSTDDTLEKARALAARDSRVNYLALSRNFGKEAAMYAGLQNATGDLVAILDADLQDPPSLLPEMVAAIQNEGYDSVATRRVSRDGEPKIRSFFARRFYALMARISDTDIVDGARDFRMMSRQFVDALLQLAEYNRFSKGLFGWVGYKTKWLAYTNVERVAGETKWSFWKLFAYSLEGIVAFSTVPLVIASVIGTVCCIFGVGYSLVIVYRRLMFGDPVAGWATIAAAVFFLGGLQMLFTGILGQYLAKTYLETKRRPIYLLRENSMDGTGIRRSFAPAASTLAETSATQMAPTAAQVSATAPQPTTSTPGTERS